LEDMRPPLQDMLPPLQDMPPLQDSSACHAESVHSLMTPTMRRRETDNYVLRVWHSWKKDDVDIHCAVAQTTPSYKADNAIQGNVNLSKGEHSGDRYSRRLHREHVHNAVASKPDLWQVCSEWALAHIHSPFPSSEEKDALAQMTGVSRGRVNNWFGNWRSRHWRDEASARGVLVNERTRIDPQKRNADVVLQDKCKEWLQTADNMSHPYPCDEVIQGLAALSGKSKTSVDTWFVNWRKRKWSR
jgi:hypothetical protein